MYSGLTERTYQTRSKKGLKSLPGDQEGTSNDVEEWDQKKMTKRKWNMYPMPCTGAVVVGPM